MTCSVCIVGCCALIAAGEWTFGKPSTQTRNDAQAFEWTFAADPAAKSFAGFVGVTSGQLGFRDKDGHFYPLGMPADEFIQKFGPQDRGGPHAFLDYLGDGLKVQLDQQRRTIGYIFYPAGSETTKFKAARFMTDQGITVGATFREIVMKHGKPLADESSENMRYVNYPWGTFIFIGGDLYSIHIGGPGKPWKT